MSAPSPHPARLRRLCIALLILGALATAYTGWSWHRISDEVLVEDRSWPRAQPYPDGWLLALNDWFDVRHPAPRGAVKLHGEIGRVRLALLAALSVSTCAMLCGAVPLAWPWLRHVRWASASSSI